MKASGSPARRRGRLVSALAALLVGLLLVAGLEGALRLLGLGGAPAHASRLRYQGLLLPALVPDVRPDGTAVWRTADPRLAFRAMRRPKPPGTLRLCAFGGSATAGLGFSPNGSFPAALERMLRAALPGRDVEVLNLGIVALASKQVQALVAEACARYEPDAVLVYSGNNEYLEVHADKYAAVHDGVLARCGAALAELNLARLLRGVVQRAPDGSSLAGWEAANEELRLTQAEIIRDVEMSADVILGAFERY